MSFDDCPCEDCIYYESMKRHPNPNAVDPDYCNLKHSAIYKTSHRHITHPDRWIMPCGGHRFTRRDDMTGVIGYDKKNGYILG
jgi:hypothetical protein